MRVVLDETVLIRHFEGEPAATGVLASAAMGGHEVWSVPLIRAKILLERGEGDLAAALRLIDRLRWLHVTLELANLAVELAPNHQADEPTLIDLLVAAAARYLEAKLITLSPECYPTLAGVHAAY